MAGGRGGGGCVRWRAIEELVMERYVCGGSSSNDVVQNDVTIISSHNGDQLTPTENIYMM